MGFLNSAMLWGLLAVSVPLAIHLIHRRKAMRVPFPAIEFILRSRKAVARRFRVKQLLLLALRCLLVGAAAVAAARPLFAGRDAAVGPSGGPAAVAIAVDTSMSMRTRIGNGADETAFQAAQAAALSLVDSLGPDVEAVIVPFDGDAKAIPNAPTADKTILAATLHDLKAGFGTTSIEKALDTAASAIATSQKPKKIVYVFTDGAQPGWREALPRDATQGIAWRLIDVTSKATVNAAIVGLELHEESGGATSRTDVQSFSETPIGGAGVELLIGDNAVGRNFVDLAPGATASTTFTMGAPPAGLNVAVARLVPDSLGEDDTRYAVFRGRARIRTLIVDGDPRTTIRDAEAFYLERALSPAREVTNAVAPVVVDGEGLARANLSQFDVVVLANVGTLPATIASSLRRWVDAGGGLMMTAGDRVDPEVANANLGDLLPMRLRGIRTTKNTHTEGGAQELAALSLAPPSVAHPVTGAIDAAGTEVFATTRFKTTELLEGAGAGASIILKFSDGSPALVERALGRGRIVFFASTIDREWNDLPISTIYLPMMRRMVRYLAGELGEAGTTEVLVGHPVKIEVGDRKAVRVEGPDGFPAQVLPAVEGAVEIVPPLPGIYRLSKDDGTADERLAGKGFAANVDTTESDLRKVGRAELARVFAGVDFDTSGGLGGNGSDKSAVPDTPVWGLLLAAGVVALALEGVVTGL